MIILFKCLFVVAVILASVIIIFSFLSDDHYVRNKRQSHQYLNDERRNSTVQHLISFEDIVKYGKKFNMSGQDLLILLHIQKTGGTTFERHLVHDLKIPNQCSCNEDKRRCSCPRPNQLKNLKTYADATWLISRFSTGWVCGLHPDWTQLNHCLQRLHNLFFVTFLRHPLFRFISEYRHVQRGATWKASKIYCSQYNTQLCFANQTTWQNVTLEEFMNCKHNMAINRQTRMLYDYNRIGCPSDKDAMIMNKDILSSAINNLKTIAFFGLCEQQKASQVVFEKTFNLEFDRDFEQSEDSKTRALIEGLSRNIIERILRLNHLDLELYRYAQSLFVERCKQLTGDCRDYRENRFMQDYVV